MAESRRYPWEQPDYSQVVQRNALVAPMGSGASGREARRARIEASKARREALPRRMTGTQFSPLSAALSEGMGPQYPPLSSQQPTPRSPLAPPQMGVSSPAPVSVQGAFPESVVPVPSLSASTPAGSMPTWVSSLNQSRSALAPQQFSELPPQFRQRFMERQKSGANPPGMTEQDALEAYNKNYLGTGRGLPATQFSDLPPEFQARFEERAAQGLGNGVTQQQAVEFYNRNYLGRELPRTSLPGGVQGPLPDVSPGIADAGRIAAIADMYDLANIPIPQSIAETVAAARQARGAGTLANTLESDRMNRTGLYGGPSQEDIDRFNADVAAARTATPDRRAYEDFINQTAGMTEQGRAAMMDQLDQSYLSKPMQGGGGISGATPLDRQRRLDMLEAQRSFGQEDQMARRSQVGSSADQTVRAALMQQGITQEQLDEIAQMRNDPDIALGGRRAMFLLAPGTQLRTPEGGLIMRGADRQTTPEDLARKQAGREADTLAVERRLVRNRQGRMAMRQQAEQAQRQAFEMATNPMVNPMLVANNPEMLAQVFGARRAEQELAANAPVREAEIKRYEAETKKFESDVAANEKRIESEGLTAETARRKAELEIKGLEIANRAGELQLTPEALERRARNESIGVLATLPPEFDPVLRRQITQEARGGARSPLAPPTIQDSVVEAQSLAGPVSEILGFDPEGRSPEQIVDALSKRTGTTAEIAGEDLAVIKAYMEAKSRAVPGYLEPGLWSRLGGTTRGARESWLKGVTAPGWVPPPPPRPQPPPGTTAPSGLLRPQPGLRVS